MTESDIKLALYNWLSLALGEPHGFVLSFDADFVTGNVINGTFGTYETVSNEIAPVSFDTDHDTTMTALAEAIQRLDTVFSAAVTDDREITITGKYNGFTVDPLITLVTGGASQAVAIFTDFQEAVAVPVIHADQAAPRPETYPYATIRIDSVQKIGWDELRYLDPNTNLAALGGQRKGTVSIEYFGNNPVGGCMDAYNSLEKQTYIDQLSDDGIAILEKNSVQNLTAVLETIFEPRAVFDFTIGFADNFSDDLGVIENVELAGTVYDANDGEINVGPILIDP